MTQSLFSASLVCLSRGGVPVTHARKAALRSVDVPLLGASCHSSSRRGTGPSRTSLIITLGVSDLGRPTRFYRDGLGFPEHEAGGDEITFLALTGQVLA